MTSFESTWLVNGGAPSIHPSDRGLAYGDGLFETMGARDGRVRWLGYHLDRLLGDCARLAIPAPRRDVLEAEIARIVPRRRRAVVKLVVTRGPGARGYTPPIDPSPTRILSVSPWPEYDAENYTAGIALGLSEIRLGENPALAGIKHLCRLEQVLARGAMAGSQCKEHLMLSQSGQVIGGTMSNVFIVNGQRLRTPRLDKCGVRGVMRRCVLQHAGQLGLEAVEEDLSLADLASAEEIFVTNSLIGVWSVHTLDGRAIAVGPTAPALADLLERGDAHET